MADSYESNSKRASRIRENQRRCRERKLAYISTLEQQLREYEKAEALANIELQRVTQKVHVENEKMKVALSTILGLEASEITALEPELLSRHISVLESQTASSNKQHRANESSDVTPSPSPSSFSVASPATSIRCQRGAGSWIMCGSENQPWLTITVPDCNTTTDLPMGISLVAEPLSDEISGSEMVWCNLSYDLLKHILDLQYPRALEEAGFRMKEGILVQGNGKNVDGKLVTNLIRQFTNVVREAESTENDITETEQSIP